MEFSCKNIIIILSFLTFIYFCIKKGYEKYKLYKNTKENKFILDKSEYPENFEYKNADYSKDDTEITFIFWSGGLSSTYRLCELLLIEQKVVQPIYIHTENFGRFQLKNRQEIERMKKIRKTLYEDYPILKERLAPTMYIDFIKRDPIITKKFNNLHTNHKMFNENEKNSIYENIARYSSNFNNMIEFCVDGTNDEVNYNLKPYLKDTHKNNLIKTKKLKTDIPVYLEDIHIFDKLIFPLLHYNKDEIKMQAIKFNFYYIIKLTWSCDHPIENSNNNSIESCLNCRKCLNRNI